jgi:hypothetical protein
MRITASLAAILVGLCACGGGGGGNSGSGGSANPNVWTPGVYLPHAGFAAKCASPRSGASAVTGQAYPDVQGTLLDENNWLPPPTSTC